MSGSMVLLQLAVLMLVTCITMEGCTDRCPWSVLPPEAMLMSLGHATAEDCVGVYDPYYHLLTQGWISVVSAVTRNHVEVREPCPR